MSSRQHFLVYKKNPPSGQVRATPAPYSLVTLDEASVELGFKNEGNVYFVRDSELRNVQLPFSDGHVCELVVQHTRSATRKDEEARVACAIKFTGKAGSTPVFAVLVFRQEYDRISKCHFNRVVFIGIYEHMHKRLALTVGDDGLKTDTAVCVVMGNLKCCCTAPDPAASAASSAGAGVDRAAKRMKTTTTTTTTTTTGSSNASAAAMSSLVRPSGLVVFDDNDDDDMDGRRSVPVRYYAPYGRPSAQSVSTSYRRTQPPPLQQTGSSSLRTMASRIEIPAPSNDTTTTNSSTMGNGNNNRRSNDQPTGNGGGFTTMVRNASSTLRMWWTNVCSFLSVLWELGCGVVEVAVNLWPLFAVIFFLIVIGWVLWQACSIVFFIMSWGSSGRGHPGMVDNDDGGGL